MPPDRPHGLVLVVAGSDPLGFSGLQADLTHLASAGRVGMGVPTCLTEQTPSACRRILPVDAGHVCRAIELARDQGVGSVKIGLLHRPEVVEAVAAGLEGVNAPIVLDPVLRAGSGDALIGPGTVEALKRSILPRTTLVTPNLPELGVLAGADPARTRGQRETQSRTLLAGGATWVLVKGGHEPESAAQVSDLLVGEGEPRSFTGKRHQGTVPRGTGCALSSLIAAALADGLEVPDAVAWARALLDPAIAEAMRIGSRRLSIRT